MRTTTLSAALLLGLISFSLPGCLGLDEPYTGDAGNSEPEEEDYVEGEPVRPPEFDYLWDRARFILQADGYGIDEMKTLRSERFIVTSWKTLLHPNRYKGRRTRCWVRFVDDPDGAVRVQLAMQLQINVDIDEPSNPLRAKWRDEPADLKRANVLVYKMESGFRE